MKTYEEIVSEVNELHPCSDKEAAMLYAEQFKPKWIPVSEILPDKTGYVIGKSYAVIPFYFKSKTNSFHWVDMDGDCNTVSHWMPLPDAP